MEAQVGHDVEVELPSVRWAVDMSESEERQGQWNRAGSSVANCIPLEGGTGLAGCIDLQLEQRVAGDRCDSSSFVPVLDRHHSAVLVAGTRPVEGEARNWAGWVEGCMNPVDRMLPVRTAEPVAGVQIAVRQVGMMSQGLGMSSNVLEPVRSRSWRMGSELHQRHSGWLTTSSASRGMQLPLPRLAPARIS